MPDFYDDRLLSSLIERNPVTVPPFTSTTQANAVGTPTGRLIDPATGFPLSVGGKDALGLSLKAMGIASGSVNVPGGVIAAVYANYARTRASLAACQAANLAGVGGTYFDFFLVGDSTEAGYYTNSSTIQYTGIMQKSPGIYCAQALSNAGYRARMDINFGDQGALLSGSNLPTQQIDLRLGLGSAIGSNSTLTVGGGLIGTASTTATGLAILTPYEPVDTYEVFYPQASSYTTSGFTLSMTGASNIIINNNSASSGGTYSRAVLQGTLGSPVNALSIQGTTGTSFYAGIRPYDSTKSYIRVHNFGIGSAKASDWNLSTFGYSPKPGLIALAGYNSLVPCCKINLGINEWVNAVGASTFQTNLSNLVAGILPYMDVILESPFPSAQSNTTLLSQAPYVAAIKAVAAANNLLYNDLWSALGSQELQAQLGVFNNVIHPQSPLYQQKGIAAARLLLSVGT